MPIIFLKKLATSGEVREVLLLVHDENIIIALKEYFLLNDLKTVKNLNFSYWMGNSL